jgi:hypothetical protein
MENAELDLLLSKNRLFFQWSETSSTWRLSPQKKYGENLEARQSQSAVNIEAAQAAAIQVLYSLRQPENRYSKDGSELDSLLNKYRLSFNWGNPGLRWWLVGQNKGSNALCRTVPHPAKDIETAKVDAVQYIIDVYQTPHTQTEIES